MTKWTHRHPRLAAFIDWVAVFTASVSFVFIALWAASPDDAALTLREAILRAVSYALPITLGMWGIARATRRGSAVPGRMSEAMPYARLGKDGKPEAVTWTDQTPNPIGDSSAHDQ